MYINMHAAQTLVNIFLNQHQHVLFYSAIYKLLRDHRVTLNAVRGSFSSLLLLLPYDALSSLLVLRLNIHITVDLTINKKGSHG